MSIAIGTGIVLAAIGVALFAFSRWQWVRESVQNGLVPASCVSFLVNGIVLVVIAAFL